MNPELQITGKVVREADFVAHGKTKNYAKALEVQCAKCDTPKWRYRDEDVVRSYLLGKAMVVTCPWCATDMLLQLGAKS